jgi:hypothetical protein
VNLTWQAVVLALGVLVALTVMFIETDDETTRRQILGYVDTIVPFLLGAGTGAALTYARYKP